MAARWMFSCPANWLGSACSAMVEYERMSLMRTVTLTRSVSPILRPSRRSFSASPPGSSRDSVSPCSSRSTIALCRSRSRCRAPSVPAETPSASLTNTASTSASTASGGRRLARGDGLDRLALRHHAEELLLGRRETAVGGHRAQQRVDDGRIERVPAGGDRPDRVDQLIALRDVVLQEVPVAG